MNNAAIMLLLNLRLVPHSRSASTKAGIRVSQAA
jgi:hypothetical protein